MPAKPKASTDVVPASPSHCPSCGKSARGRFCANCGAILEEATCAACDAPLASGDRHCSACGAGVGSAADSRRAREGQRTAWIVAGIAFAALLLLVLVQRAREFRASSAPAVAAEGMAPGAPAGGSGGLSAQDIAAMPPREQMDRLFDRIMRLREEGKTDSVRFFAPMVMGLYERPDLQPLDADLRYDYGTVANAAGEYAIERAQSDTLLTASPDHLLGLVMRIRSARGQANEADARRAEQQLVAAEPKERPKALPEYQRHRADIDEALKKARGQ